MRQSLKEVTIVTPHESFALLSKEHQLVINPEITEHLQKFYANNNMLAMLNTLIDAHSSLLEVNNSELTKKQDDNIHLLVNFFSTLTHYQLLKK